MIETFKGRELQQGQRVKVYFNLHTHLFSVKDLKTGLVVAHGDNILLEGIQFKVSKAGRAKVLREKKKNVHAYVIGNFVKAEEGTSKEFKSAYYNPYKVDSFVDADTGSKLSVADVAYLSNKRVGYVV